MPLTLNLPAWLPQRGWSLHNKGYVIFSSRATRVLTAFNWRRGKRLHVAVVERQIGRPLDPGEVVHHQNFNKRCVCDFNLILMPASFNPSPALRDPYTGEFLSPDAYARRYDPDYFRRGLTSVTN